MRFIATLLLACHAASQDLYDDQTVLSITSGGSMVDVGTIPDLLARRGARGDQRIASFLSTSRIRTLKHAQCQIVPTSTGSVSHDDLCSYLNEARRYLPNLDVTCSGNINGEVTQLDDSLHVNDPNASLQTQLD
ncbi:Suppressor of the cold-sensitive snRNP bioproteinsis mutant brr1-1, partial [Perkinsus chesapeaki]